MGPIDLRIFHVAIIKSSLVLAERVHLVVFSFNDKIVADTVLAFDAERGVKSDDFAVRHDANTVRKHIGFFNMLGAQDHAAGPLHLFNELPYLASGVHIKTGGWLVQNDDAAFAHETHPE